MTHESERPTCFTCKKTIPPSPWSITPGYGLDKDSNKICYECCAEEDKRIMRETGHIALYLTMDREPKTRWIKSAKITNWPGSLKFENLHVSIGSHNWAGTRYDTWFVFETYIWHGVRYGDMTEIVHCKRTKQTTT